MTKTDPSSGNQILTFKITDPSNKEHYVSWHDGKWWGGENLAQWLDNKLMQPYVAKACLNALSEAVGNAKQRNMEHYQGGWEDFSWKRL